MEHAPDWMRGLEPRELAQVYHALAYAKDFSAAGVPGHSQHMLVAKLAGMLDTTGITAAVQAPASINDAISAIGDIAELVGWPCFDINQADDNFAMQFKRGGL